MFCIVGDMQPSPGKSVDSVDCEVLSCILMAFSHSPTDCKAVYKVCNAAILCVAD